MDWPLALFNQATRAAPVRQDAPIESIIYSDGTTRRCLHVFDMDGTLLPGTTASLQIAQAHGGEERLQRLYRKFRDGLLDARQFAAALHRGWMQLTDDDVTRAFEAAPKIRGIRRTVEDIHSQGDIAVVVSMSPDFFVERWLSYGFDRAIGSRFPAVPFTEPFDPAGILTFDDKPKIVEELRSRLNISMSRVIAYGDSQSDVPMFRVAGVSVAVNGDDHVRHLATHAYDGDDIFDAYQLARAAPDSD